ncbi:MAG: 50S ribosomal protein L29 [Parachlamydiales bacterium]|jgi:large subunit ribosomal protein L29
MVKINEIRDQSEEHLQYRLSEINRERFDIVNELKAAHKTEKPHLLKELKKEKARILTVLTERKNSAERKKDGSK